MVQKWLDGIEFWGPWTGSQAILRDLYLAQHLEMDHTCFCDMSGLYFQSTAGEVGIADSASPLIGSRSPLVSDQSPVRERELSNSSQGS